MPYEENQPRGWVKTIRILPCTEVLFEDPLFHIQQETAIHELRHWRRSLSHLSLSNWCHPHYDHAAAGRRTDARTDPLKPPFPSLGAAERRWWELQPSPCEQSRGRSCPREIIPHSGPDCVALREAACHVNRRYRTAPSGSGFAGGLQRMYSLSQRLCKQLSSLSKPHLRCFCIMGYKTYTIVLFVQCNRIGKSSIGWQNSSHVTHTRESQSLSNAECDGNGTWTEGNALVTLFLIPSLNISSQASLQHAEKV